MAAPSNNITSTFIDLSTYDEPEKFMYGGAKAITYFSKCIKKCSWFSQIPVILRQENAINFACQNAAAKVSRQGDVLLAAWLRCTTPAVTFAGVGGAGKWVDDLAVNMISEINLSFNDIVAQRMDSHWLNFWFHFTTPESKANGLWNNMIGNPALSPLAGAIALPQTVLNLPIPMFFSRDTGCGLPVAPLPYNDIKLNFTLRTAAELIITTVGTGPNNLATLALTDVQVWANYAVVTNEERVKMGTAPRDMLIEQVQTIDAAMNNVLATDTNIDIRFSYSVKCLIWAANNRNTPSIAGSTTANAIELSNYGTSANNVNAGNDPLDITTLVYENTNRLDRMGSDFFSLVEPWYKWQRIPTRTGYHTYSYALHPMSMDPTASTNYSKLNVVTVRTQPSAAAVASGFAYRIFIKGLNFNIFRISGGSAGFPTM